MMCLHCHKRKVVYGRRGLCRPCHEDEAIRALYPSRLNTTRTDGDMTMEEIEALVARQYASRPEWFDRETGRAKEWEPHK